MSQGNEDLKMTPDRLKGKKTTPLDIPDKVVAEITDSPINEVQWEQHDDQR